MKITLVDSKGSTNFDIVSKKFGEANVDNMMDIVNEWKESLEAKANYKIEPYNRIIFYDDYIMIDFGSYSYFIRIDMDADEYEAYKRTLNISK